jgi:ubiquinone/menaquinone biosynthesis C-methylase UbiE
MNDASKMYNPEYTRKFYNAYGNAEWERLEATPYGRLQAIIHEDFLKRYIQPGNSVLDAGAGPGRFSIAAARAGARVTVLDISDAQLEMAKQKITEAGQLDRIDQFLRADICDLSMFKDGQFDALVCFGGALSYVCENRQKAARELVRVVKPAGTLLVSVMSRLAAVAGEAQQMDLPNLLNPDGDKPGLPGIWPVLTTGDLVFRSERMGMVHAPMHLFTTVELVTIFKDCERLETAASNAVIKEHAASVNEQLAAEPEAWATVVEMEKKLNHEPGLIDSGSHIIMAVRKKN